jgi:MYXO-CTERM domain-containing protein
MWPPFFNESCAAGPCTAFDLGSFGAGDTFAYEIDGTNSLVDLTLGANGDLTVTSVPEPSTELLLVPGLGMLGLALYRRRRSSVSQLIGFHLAAAPSSRSPEP